MEENVDQSLVGTETVAAWLAISPRYLKRLVGEKRIPFIKVGHFVRFDPVEIELWIEFHKVPVMSSSTEYPTDVPIWVSHREAMILSGTHIAPRATSQQASVGSAFRRRPLADGPN
jgi:excisionase family DNA binding protein